MIKCEGRIIADRVHVADKLYSRLKGLIGTRGMQSGEAMVLIPCNSVHTWFMKYPIDVIITDREGMILRIREGLTPWKFGPWASKGRMAIELPQGTINRHKIQVGERLILSTKEIKGGW